MAKNPNNLIIRHQDEAAKERSACGHRYRLLSQGDEGVAAWAHAVDIDGAKTHYHKISTELYYVLEGEGKVLLDGEEQEVRPGTMVHIPPGVVHWAVADTDGKRAIELAKNFWTAIVKEARVEIKVTTPIRGVVVAVQ